jgi:hypothetical protein
MSVQYLEILNNTRLGDILEGQTKVVPIEVQTKSNALMASQTIRFMAPIRKGNGAWIPT